MPNWRRFPLIEALIVIAVILIVASVVLVIVRKVGEKGVVMYGWQEIYQRAMLETDRSKLWERIESAQTSIDRRLQEINAGHDSVEERRAIRDALAGLKVLRREVLAQASD